MNMRSEATEQKKRRSSGRKAGDDLLDNTMYPVTSVAISEAASPLAHETRSFCSAFCRSALIRSSFMSEASIRASFLCGVISSRSVGGPRCGAAL